MIRWGIIAPGGIANAFAKEVIKTKDGVLSAVYGRNEDKTKELAKENNVFIMEALWTLFLPAINQAKAWIEEGKIGKVKLITANFGFKSECNLNSRLYNPNLAGGALLDVGIYPILFSNYIANSYPKEIKASAEFTKTNVDESNIINLKYEDGALASLTCSIAVDTDNTAIIYGEKGKIVIQRFWAAKEAYLYTEDTTEKYIDEYEEAGIQV